MFFTKYLCSAENKNAIENYWIIENDGTNIKVEKIIPDGFTEIIFHYGDAYCIELQNDWQIQQKQLLAGQIRKYFFLKNTGKSGILGIKCKPTALTNLFGLDMSHYTDKVVDLHSVPNDPFSEVENIAFKDYPNEIKIGLIDDWFKKQSCIEKNEEIEKAVSLIFEKKGLITVNELTTQLFITERQLERLFKKFIGLPPKFYAGIIRFSHIFSLIQDKKLTWTDLAYESGYYDISHFVKNFKSFTGEDPSKYTFEDENLANFFLLKKPF